MPGGKLNYCSLLKNADDGADSSNNNQPTERITRGRTSKLQASSCLKSRIQAADVQASGCSTARKNTKCGKSLYTWLNRKQWFFFFGINSALSLSVICCSSSRWCTILIFITSTISPMTLL